MHDSTLAKRYALALAELADEGNNLDKVGADLANFLEVVNVTPGLKSMLSSPTVPRAEQQSVVTAFIKSSGCEGVTGKFLRVLVEKRRMAVLKSIVAAYDKNVEERSGRITVHVASAKPLIQKHEERLVSSLSEMTGKKVQLDVSTDSALLGGVVLRVGSVMMDYSVRGQLNRLKSQMRG